MLCRIFSGTGKACVCGTCHLLQSIETNVCRVMMEGKQGRVQNSGDQSKAQQSTLLSCFDKCPM